MSGLVLFLYVLLRLLLCLLSHLPCPLSSSSSSFYFFFRDVLYVEIRVKWGEKLGGQLAHVADLPRHQHESAIEIFGALQ